MRKNVLSKRQRSILIFLNEYSEQHGFYPTIREIGTGVSINSTSVVQYHLTRLTEQGYLAATNRRSRTTRLTEKGYEAVNAAQKLDPLTSGDTAAQEIRRLKAQIERLRHSFQTELDAVRRERDDLRGALINLQNAVL